MNTPRREPEHNSGRGFADTNTPAGCYSKLVIKCKYRIESW